LDNKKDDEMDYKLQAAGILQIGGTQFGETFVKLREADETERPDHLTAPYDGRYYTNSDQIAAAAHVGFVEKRGVFLRVRFVEDGSNTKHWITDLAIQ
jgi:hypothetical protein